MLPQISARRQQTEGRAGEGKRQLFSQTTASGTFRAEQSFLHRALGSLAMTIWKWAREYRDGSLKSKYTGRVWPTPKGYSTFTGGLVSVHRARRAFAKLAEAGLLVPAEYTNDRGDRVRDWEPRYGKMLLIRRCLGAAEPGEVGLLRVPHKALVYGDRHRAGRGGARDGTGGARPGAGRPRKGETPDQARERRGLPPRAPYAKPSPDPSTPPAAPTTDQGAADGFSIRDTTAKSATYEFTRAQMAIHQSATNLISDQIPDQDPEIPLGSPSPNARSEEPPAHPSQDLPVAARPDPAPTPRDVKPENVTPQHPASPACADLPPPAPHQPADLERALSRPPIVSYQVPAPPPLDPDLPDVERARVLVEVHASLAAAVTGKHRKVWAHGLARRRDYPALRAAAQALVDSGLPREDTGEPRAPIAPMAWAAWSLRSWRAMGNAGAPPAGFVWSAKRIAEHGGWFRAESAEWGAQQAVVCGGAWSRLLRLWHAMDRDLRAAGIDRWGRDPRIREVVDRHLPGDAYDRLLAEARGQAERASAALRARVACGEFLGEWL